MPHISVLGTPRTATILCRHAKCAELAADIAEFTLDPSHVVSRQP
jgi:hypothetical protein